MKTFIVDIDGTICQNTFGEYEKAKPILERISYFNNLYDSGYEIIYWTARGGRTLKDWTDFTIKQLNDWGVKYTKLQMNKPVYDYWVDDKSENVDNYFNELVYIHHHLGLGDHFVCEPIVRIIAEKYKHVILAVKEHNLSSVASLYSNVNIIFDVVKDDEDAQKQYKNKKVIRIGFEHCSPNNWEQSFYDQLNIPYSIRYDNKFSITRKYLDENQLYESLNLPKKYAFCNTSCSLGNIDIDIDTNLHKVYLTNKTKNILDWLKVIENAEEIHTIDSSIFQLIKNLKLKKRKVFYDVSQHITRMPYTFEDESWEIKIV